MLTGTISPGDLVMFLAYLVMRLAPLATLASSATQFQNSLAGLDRILDQFEQFCTVSQSVAAALPLTLTVLDSDGQVLKG